MIVCSGQEAENITKGANNVKSACIMMYGDDDVTHSISNWNRQNVHTDTRSTSGIEQMNRKSKM
jgi:hypothetical protein